MDIIAETYTVHVAEEREQLDAFLTTYRRALNESLDGLTEDEARAQLVPSKTTLLGLVKHAAYVEQVWFVETLTGTPRADLGLPPTVDDSYDLDPEDTIAGIQARHREVADASARAVAGMPLETVLTGHPRIAEVTLRWVLLHVVRELAQHVGHAEILREQVLAARSG
ncbi:DinB family protein [Marmoricola sp. OAE513]|uniref:DinB family protein n=1 Tax=Marmoricola sp. OAE513 TaxID=2817894 RepID=UPI001D552B77